MTLASRVLVAALWICLPASALSAQNDRADEGHWSCFAFTPDAMTYYTTGVWDGKAFMSEVSNAFAQELKQKHGYTGRVSCSRATMEGSTLAKNQADLTSRSAQWRAAGKKVIDVAWTFNPATATLPHLCTGFVQFQKDGQRTNYFYVNHIIRLPGATQAAATRAWDDHLKSLRPGSYFPVPAGCALLPPDPEGQQRQVDGTIQMYQAQKPELVRLQWNYVAPTSAAAAATKTADDAPAFYCEMVDQGNKAWYATAVQPADPAWKWDDYTRAWRLYAKNTLKLDLNLFIGACEPGTMKHQLRARAVRKEGFSGQGWAKLHDVDWKYTP